MLPMIAEVDSSTEEISGTNNRLGESGSHKLSPQHIVLHFWGSGLCTTGAPQPLTQSIWCMLQ